jgi:hypothetical protein
MKIIFSFILLMGFFLTTAIGQVGQQFPELKGETLDDHVKTIPADTKGKFTILALAYSTDAENDLSSWASPVYNKFIAKTGMVDDLYDINLYFVPMFTGGNITMIGAAKRNMKKDTNKDLYPYVLFYKGDIDPYKETLKISKKDTPYIFVLDAAGKVVYSTSGVYTDKKMEEIEDIIE